VFSSPIAALMATESARRTLTEPVREVAVRKPRRAAALVLQRVAHRLDPYVAASPQVTVGR
jgi:hypothetical protein